MGLLATITMIALGGVHYYSVRGAIMEDVYQRQLITDLRAHQSELLITLEKAMETSLTIADDPAFIQWFSQKEVDPNVKALALEKLNFLNKELKYPTIFAVSNTTYEYWYQDHNLLDIVSEDDPDDSWFFETLRHSRKSTLNFDFNNVLKQSMLFVNVIMGSPSQPVGVAGVGIDPSILIEQFKENKPSPDSHLWLIDRDGKILLSEDMEEINSNLSKLFEASILKRLLNGSNEQVIREVRLEDTTYELASMTVGTTDYRVIMVVPQKDLLAFVDVIGYNTIWLTFIALFLTLLMSSRIAKNISMPIIDLAQLSKQIAHSKSNVGVKDKLMNRRDEIGQLAREFDGMQKQLSHMIRQLNKANADLENEKTQLKSINIDLQKAIEKASESERLTKAFMANISHEVRTPMNSIMGFAQLIEDELSDDDSLRQYARLVVKNGHDLLAILNNIIEVAKMDSGITKPSMSEFSAKEVVKEGISLFSLSTRNNVSLINNAADCKDDTLLKSDELLVKRILNNLLSNAIKYTHEGTIEVGFRTTDSEIIFYVSDTGIGISANDQPSVFKPFWQASHSASLNEGAGLGLAISQKMVEVLSGRIWLKSEPGKGSVFYFALPLHLS